MQPEVSRPTAHRPYTTLRSVGAGKRYAYPFRMILIHFCCILEANRQVVARENRISKIVGGTSIEIVLNADGPTKQEIRVPTELYPFSTSDGLSTFTVAKPHISMLGFLKCPLIHIVTYLPNLSRTIPQVSRGWSFLSFLNYGGGDCYGHSTPNRESVHSQEIPKIRIGELEKAS